MSDEIKVGDLVEVINNGKSYTTYEDWFKENNASDLRKLYKFDDLLKDGTLCNVIKTGKHSWQDALLVAVQSLSKDQRGVYLIGAEGLKVVKRRNV